MICIYKTNSLRCSSDFIVKSTLESKFDGQTVFIAPESSKAAIERLVINYSKTFEGSNEDPDVLNIKSSFVNGDVLSFMRLATRISDMCGLSVSSCGDSLVLRTAIYRILASHHSEFETFGKFVGKFEYIDGLIELLGDFTRYGITEDSIASAYENALSEDSESIYCKKIHDFKLLSDYISELNLDYDMNLLSNSISEVNKLLERLIDNRDLLNTRRYREFSKFVKSRFSVIGFGAIRLLTPQELKLVSNLNRLGATFNFYPISSDGLEKDADPSVYVNGDEFIRLLESSCSDVVVSGFDISSDMDLGLKAASRNYALKKQIPSDDLVKTDKIKHVSIHNLDDRIGYISNEIIRLTRYEGYRYKDIRIVCVDEGIIERLRSVMTRYGLASFVDRKILVSNTPVFRFIVLLLELPIRYFLLDDVLCLLRTGIPGITSEDVDAFENYCVKNNITDGRRMFDQDFFTSSGKHPSRLYRANEEVMEAEYLWENVVKRVLMPIHDVSMSIYNEKTLSSKADKLANYVDTFASDIEALIKELKDRQDIDRASALIRGYKEVMSLLVNFTLPMNDVEIKQEHFLSLIKIDMRNKSQGTIPLMVDSVDIVTTEQACFTPCKVMFVIGATNENFPYKRMVDGLMNSNELSKFAVHSKVDLPDKAQARTRTEFITSALMFNSVSELVYFVNEYGKAESNVYNFFSRYSSEALLENCFVDRMYGNEVIRRHDFMEAAISPEVISSLIGDSKRISVSSLEKYNSCHMKYMIQDVLGIVERDDGREVKANSMGSIIHHMFEKYLSELYSRNMTIADYKSLSESLVNDEAELERIAVKYFDDYCNSSELMSEKTEQFRIYPGIKARRFFKCSLPAILDDIVETGYVPTKFELNIDKEGNGLKVNVDGIDFKFIGYIDRIDTNEESGKLRVIDYKTGDKGIKLKKNLAGVQIQLFGYANSISDLGEVAEVGYFPIGLKAEKGTDLKLEPNFASLSSEEFKTVCDYVDFTIKKSCKDIVGGKADAIVNSQPSGSRIECEFCPFASSCGNNKRNPVKKVLSEIEVESTDKESKPEIDEMRRRME